jgi:hypothetical protein
MPCILSKEVKPAISDGLTMAMVLTANASLLLGIYTPLQIRRTPEVDRFMPHLVMLSEP